MAGTSGRMKLEGQYMHRRQFLTTTMGAALTGLAAPALAQAKTKLRVGYLHTLAVDGQIWTGMDRGSFERNGLDLELRQFNTGLEVFQALIGGSLDVLATGAVISNFPARGQGKVFLINDIEVATAQLWVHSGQGIKSFADLKGKRIATTTGTTAHVFLDRALRANSVDPKDVEFVNQAMPAAVTSFISGAVPAVALWVPFNITVRDKVTDAVKLADASAYYPQAAIIDGWAAANNFYDANKETLVKLIKGWTEANDYIIAQSDAALESLQKGHYSQVPLSDLMEQFAAQKMFTARDWKKLYADGTVTNWLQQSTDFFMANAGVKNFTAAAEYFDTRLYLETVA
jgi:NitT/TauT family transport system substrate-binding protein